MSLIVIPPQLEVVAGTGLYLTIDVCLYGTTMMTTIHYYPVVHFLFPHTWGKLCIAMSYNKRRRRL